MQQQDPGSNQDPFKPDDKKSVAKKYLMRIGKLMLLLTIVGCTLLTIASFAIDHIISSTFKQNGL